MKVTFMQTADAVVYREMLEITSRTFTAYCGMYDCRYESYVGVIRGDKPWHAALNRVALIKAMMARGEYGWVVHADADAYIANMTFDIRQYLGEKNEFFMVASPSGIPSAPWWDINNGVFALNLDHPLSSIVIDHWWNLIEQVPTSRLDTETAWGEVIDDQHLLHMTLQALPQSREALLLDASAFNGSAHFLPQLMRAPHRTQASRVATLRERTAAALDGVLPAPEIAPDEQARRSVYEEFVNTLYSVFFGRAADAGGRKHALDRLASGLITMEEELRACLASPEGRAQLTRLLN